MKKSLVYFACTAVLVKSLVYGGKKHQEPKTRPIRELERTLRVITRRLLTVISWGSVIYQVVDTCIRARIVQTYGLLTH